MEVLKHVRKLIFFYCSQDNVFQNPLKMDMKSVYWGSTLSTTAAAIIMQNSGSINIWKTLKFIWVSATIYFLGSIILELLWRILIIPSEIKLSQENSVYFVIRKVLVPNFKTIWLIVFTTISFFLVLLNCSDPLGLMESGGLVPNIFLIIGVSLMVKVVNMSESLQTLCEFVRAGHGLDYGSGMAYSYFYGYLNFILPNRGDENVGLRENIERYESNHGITIPVKKLFILIPDSMYFTPSLESDDERVKSAGNLETIVRNVAGVRERHYKNSVYKIKKRNSDGTFYYVYVVAEGATPLHTLRQATYAQGPACTPEMRLLKLELVRQFYQTLDRVLNCYRDCQGTFELIYYNDVDGVTNIADLLLERIEAQQH